MIFSRYLYCKVKESKKSFISLLLEPQEIDFLNEFEIDFYFDSNSERYIVDCNRIKELFCN